MKKGIVILITLLLLASLVTTCYAAARKAQIVNQYRTLCAQEKETEQLLEGTQAALQEIQGRLRERRVADKEIAALKKTIKGLEEQILEKQIKELTKEETEAVIKMIEEK